MQLHGRCCALFAFDVARELDLDQAGRILSRDVRRTFYRHKSPAPDTETAAPLRFSRPHAALELAGHPSSSTPQVALYATGAVVITWFFPFQTRLDRLPAFAAALYANELLIERSRLLVEEVCQALGPALRRPSDAGLRPEDYVVFQVRAPAHLAHLQEPDVLARVLRADENALSDEEIADALAARVSYAPGETCIVDWNSAWLAGENVEDERFVLELATVELLELRLLDRELDRGLDRAYRALERKPRAFGRWSSGEDELELIARLQADEALVHEGVDNAQKLLGDDYLARLYRTATRRFHFDEWDAIVQRKLRSLDAIYRKLADQAARRRSEALEWIIIMLIAIDVVMYLLPLGLGGTA